MNRIDCYVITLKDMEDVALRATLKPIEAMPLNIKIHKAFNGKFMDVGLYYEYLVNFFVKNDWIISPPELGCLLSHLSVYRDFLSTTKDYCVVFEDDVIIRGNFEPRLQDAVSLIGDYDLIHFGACDGLDEWMSEGLCKIIDKKKEIYEIDRSNFIFLRRMAAVMVSREFAEKILRVFDDEIFVLDHFEKIGERGVLDKILYIPVCGHPLDLAASSIEPSRRALNKIVASRQPKRLIYRLYREVLITFLPKINIIKRKIRIIFCGDVKIPI